VRGTTRFRRVRDRAKPDRDRPWQVSTRAMFFEPKIGHELGPVGLGAGAIGA
jgi:hypothetical protein